MSMPVDNESDAVLDPDSSAVTDGAVAPLAEESQVAPGTGRSSSALGAGLRLSICCPKCGQAGWIEWKSLTHSKRCPQCKCQFLIDRSGKVLSQSDLPQVHFTCPRCGKSGSIPTSLNIRKAKCVSCRFPLVAGPDQQLHGADEAAKMHRAARTAAQRAGTAQRLAGQTGAVAGQVRKLLIFGGVVLLAVLCAVTLPIVRTFFDSSPERLGHDFTATCLTGNWTEAELFLEDDAVQRIEFKRWRTRHLASILDAHRPRLDKVHIDVTDIQQVNPQARVLSVTIKSPFIGARTHEQCWRLHDGRWRFDPLQTLLREDRPQPGAGPSGRAGEGGGADLPRS